MNLSLAGPSAATLMLQSRLNQQRATARRRVAYAVLAPVLALSTFWVGSFVGGLGQTNLLENKETAFHGVKKIDKVKEQYADALLSSDNSRGRWEAVVEFHPPGESLTNRIYAGKAWLQLAALYLQKRDFLNARSVLNQILEDEQMPPLLVTLAAFQLAEVEEAADSVRGKELAIDRAKRYFESEKMSDSDRNLVRDWAESSVRPTWIRDLIDEL